MDFPGGAVVKNVLANAGDVGDVGSTPGLEILPGVRMATHSIFLDCKISRDRGALWTLVHGVTKSWTE